MGISNNSTYSSNRIGVATSAHSLYCISHHHSFTLETSKSCSPSVAGHTAKADTLILSLTRTPEQRLSVLPLLYSRTTPSTECPSPSISHSKPLCTEELLTSSDIDYEYPSNAAQGQGLADLVTELRAALDDHAQKKGDKEPYSVSASAVPLYIFRRNPLSDIFSGCSLCRSKRLQVPRRPPDGCITFILEFDGQLRFDAGCITNPIDTLSFRHTTMPDRFQTSRTIKRTCVVALRVDLVPMLHCIGTFLKERPRKR